MMTLISTVTLMDLTKNMFYYEMIVYSSCNFIFHNSCQCKDYNPNYTWEAFTAMENSMSYKIKKYCLLPKEKNSEFYNLISLENILDSL